MEIFICLINKLAKIWRKLFQKLCLWNPALWKYSYYTTLMGRILVSVSLYDKPWKLCNCGFDFIVAEGIQLWWSDFKVNQSSAILGCRGNVIFMRMFHAYHENNAGVATHLRIYGRHIKEHVGSHFTYYDAVFVYVFGMFRPNPATWSWNQGSVEDNDLFVKRVAILIKLNL